MRKQVTRILFVAGCSLCFFACNGNYKPVEELVQASTVVRSKPDSALVLLESIPAPEKMSVADYAYHQQIEEENDRIKADINRKQLFHWRVYFFSALLFALSITFFFVYRQRKVKELLAIEQALLYEREQYRDSQEKMNDNLREIQRLKDELEASNDRFNQVQEELFLAKKELLEQDNKEINISTRHTDMRRKRFLGSFIYKEVKKIVFAEDKKMPDVTWDQLKEEIDHIYEGFDNELMELYSAMRKVEIQVCYLIKAGFSATEMTILLPCGKSTISSIRSRLFEKITGKRGRPDDLDKLILNLNLDCKND